MKTTLKQWRGHLKSLAGAAVLAGVLSVGVVSCGGGGGGSGASSGPPISATGAALPGELVTFTVSGDRSSYSYTIVESAYGIAPGTTRSGTLSRNADGTFTPSVDPNSRVAFLENGLVLGFIRENLGMGLKSYPVLGIQQPITSAAAAAGTYNFVQASCEASNPANCATFFGTFRLNADGTYLVCVGANLAVTGGCPAGSQFPGTYTSTGNGRFALSEGNPATNFGSALAFTSPSTGQKVLLIDLKDSRPSGSGSNGGKGKGIVVAGEQRLISASDIAGSYVTSDGGRVVVSNEGNSYTRTDGADVTTGTIAINSPWAGFARAQATAFNGQADVGVNGYAVLGGSGVYGFVDGTGSTADPQAGLGIRFPFQ